MQERNKKRIFVLLLLGISLTVNFTAKKLGQYNIAGISTLFGYAVALAWFSDIIRDKRKNKRK